MTFQKLTARAPTFLDALSKKMGEIDQHRAVANAARAPSFSIGAEYTPGLGFVPVSRRHDEALPWQRRKNLTLFPDNYTVENR